MKGIRFAIFLFILAVMAYGYWGAFTRSGQRYYDEMDAMYPFFALLIAGAALLIFIVFLIYRYFKKK
jgi:hypothetical protein